MSRAAKKATTVAGAPSHYRRAAMAGGLIVALTLILDLVDDAPAQGDAKQFASKPPAAASAAEPAPGAAPAPIITSISIPPRQTDDRARPPILQPAADAGVADVSTADASAGSTPTCEPPPAAVPAVASSEPAPPPPGNGYFIQLGVFGAQANAETLRQALIATGTPAYIESRVVVGPYPDRKAAEAARAGLRRAGHPEGMLVPPRK